MTKQNKSTPFNIDANIIVLISYLGGLILMWIPTICYFAWIIPLIIYLTESQNKYIKKEASQSLFIYIGTSILSLIAYILLLIFSPNDYSHIYNLLASGSLIIIFLISLIVSIVKIIVSYFILIASLKAWNYKSYKIPYIQEYLKKFRKYLNKIDNKDIKEAPNQYQQKSPKKEFLKTDTKPNKSITKKIKNRKIRKH